MFLGTLSTSGRTLACNRYTGIGRRTTARQLDEVQLLALLWPCDVRGDEGVHERLEVGAPPLRQCIADLPLVVDALACELCADGRETLIQARLEAFDFVVFGAEVVAGSAAVSIGFPCSCMYVQLEEGVCDLQHEDVRVVVLVADQNGFARPSHAVLVVVLFQSLQARKH